MALIAWIAARTNSVGFLPATRYLVCERGLVQHTAGAADADAGAVGLYGVAGADVGHHLDQSYYTIGADARLVGSGAASDGGESAFGSVGFQAAGEAGATPEPEATEESAITEITGPEWVFIPVAEHLNVEEIEAAARVGDFEATVQVADAWQDATLVGVDRVDFPKCRLLAFGILPQPAWACV